jgi:hypothetical protein
MLRVVACVFFISGLLFLLGGQTAIGAANFSVGMVFMIIGAAAARKAAQSGDGIAAQPPAQGASPEGPSHE